MTPSERCPNSHPCGAHTTDHLIVSKHILVIVGGIMVATLWVGLIPNMITADVLTYWHNIPAFFILTIVMSSESLSKETLTNAD